MRTYQSYQAEDFADHGDPFAAPWDDEPKAPKGDATEKQINFLVKLMTERDLPWTQDQLDKLMKADASSLISTLLNTPKPKVPAKPKGPKTTGNAAAPEITEGMYQDPTGTIFKVQRAVHGSGHLYAKVMEIDTDPVTGVTDAWFAYAAGAIRKLRPEWRMTHEQAKAFGALYGVCCNCARTLTHEDSIFNGYGKTCAGNMGWPYERAEKLALCSKHGKPEYRAEDPYAADVDNTPGVMMTGCDDCFTDRLNDI